jgi:hypothetical protein
MNVMTTEFVEFQHLLTKTRAALAARGFCVLQVVDAGDAATVFARDYATALVARLCQPIRVLPQAGMWRNLGVDPDRPIDRSGGTGDQPVHLDFVNASLPPDYVFLFSVRSDPAGGGASLIAPISVVDGLSDELKRQLRRPIYRDGRVADLTNVGVDINPFSVLDEQARFCVRFTGKLLASTGDEAAQAALQELDKRLRVAAERVAVQAGEMLVIDQRLALHGRCALGKEQKRIPEPERRLLLHGFGRDPDDLWGLDA